ncbi:MAG: hypothetical protein IT365_04500 [Candidatus Hydrogenedentes bacterium]|nr:hypothetical protein [Candidatus Hydrogenedentota bacterium]
MRHRDIRSRTDLNCEVDEARDQLGAETKEIEKGVSDTEIVEGTRLAVKEGLTQEGADAADQHLARAEDIARDHAREHDEAAGDLQQEGEERERELDRVIDSSRETESTLGRDAKELHIHESIERVELALRAVEEETEILSSLQKRDNANRIESRRLIESLRARLTGRSSDAR